MWLEAAEGEGGGVYRTCSTLGGQWLSSGKGLSGGRLRDLHQSTHQRVSFKDYLCYKTIFCHKVTLDVQ